MPPPATFPNSGFCLGYNTGGSGTYSLGGSGLLSLTGFEVRRLPPGRVLRAIRRHNAIRELVISATTTGRWRGLRFSGTGLLSDSGLRWLALGHGEFTQSGGTNVLRHSLPQQQPYFRGRQRNLQPQRLGLLSAQARTLAIPAQGTSRNPAAPTPSGTLSLGVAFPSTAAEPTASAAPACCPQASMWLRQRRRELYPIRRHQRRRRSLPRGQRRNLQPQRRNAHYIVLELWLGEHAI